MLVREHAAGAKLRCKNYHEDHAGAIALFAAKRSPNLAPLPHAASRAAPANSVVGARSPFKPQYAWLDKERSSLELARCVHIPKKERVWGGRSRRSARFGHSSLHMPLSVCSQGEKEGR